MRRLMLKTLAMSKREAIAALCRRWKSTQHVQGMVELLAKLEGEFTKDAGDGHRGIVIILDNQGSHPWTPRPFASRCCGGRLRRGRGCGRGESVLYDGGRLREGSAASSGAAAVKSIHWWWLLAIVVILYVLLFILVKK